MIRIPSTATLKKYGLTSHEWLFILANQDYKCAICKNSLEDRRCNTDHYHVIGFKKMKPEEKKKYIRGILCWTCNKLIVGRGVTLNRLYFAVEYLEAFEKRLNEI